MTIRSLSLPSAISSESYHIVLSGSDSLISKAINKSSPEEKTAAQASTNLSNQISGDFATTFNNSQQIQGSLNSQLQNLTNQGMAGKGFMNGEEQNLRSDASENSAQATVNGQQGLQNALAKQGGSGPSGAVGSLDEKLASNSANQNATAQRGITDQNDVLARGNITNGLSGLGQLSSQETGQADALGGQAVGATGQSFSNETQAYQPSNFWGNLAGGVLSTGLDAASGNIAGAVSSGIGALGGGNQAQLSAQAGQNALQTDNDDENLSV